MTRRLILLLALTFGFASFTAKPAEAVTFRSGDEVDIPPGTVIADDLYVAGGQVRIRGRVEGDLVVMGGNVAVSGEVRDDVIVAGGDVTLTGKVGETIRAAGGTVSVSGEVGRDLILMGGRLSQLAGSHVRGATIMTGKEIAVRGTTEGILKASGRDVLIDGRVGGAEITASDVTVTAGARIDGPLSYSSDHEADIRSGATIAGPVTRSETETETKVFRLPAWLGWLFLCIAGALGGIVLALIMPGALQATSAELRRNPWLSLGAGAGIVLGVPILAILLMITLFGIPLAVTLLMLYGLAFYFAWVFAAVAIGDTILLRAPFQSPRVRMILAALLGVPLLLLLQAIPWGGPLFAFVALCAGFGAVTMALVNRLGRLS